MRFTKYAGLRGEGVWRRPTLVLRGRCRGLWMAALNHTSRLAHQDSSEQPIIPGTQHVSLLEACFKTRFHRPADGRQLLGRLLDVTLPLIGHCLNAANRRIQRGNMATPFDAAPAPVEAKPHAPAPSVVAFGPRTLAPCARPPPAGVPHIPAATTLPTLSPRSTACSIKVMSLISAVIMHV